MQQPTNGLTPEQAFGQAVNAHRVRKGWSQRELAERVTAAGLEIDASAVSRIEKGARALRLSEALIIAGTLDARLENMLDTSPELRRSRELQQLARELEAAHDDLEASIDNFAATYNQVSLEVGSARFRHDAEPATAQAHRTVTRLLKTATVYNALGRGLFEVGGFSEEVPADLLGDARLAEAMQDYLDQMIADAEDAYIQDRADEMRGK